jgi:hypothetical protein
MDLCLSLRIMVLLEKMQINYSDLATKEMGAIL